MNIENLLYTLKYNPDDISHLIADNKMCTKCKNKNCTHVCPAGVYEWNNEFSQLVINYENCLECGACRVACPYNAIDWSYPSGNKGVTFRQG